MENTKENKAKFFAQYYGLEVLKFTHEEKSAEVWDPHHHRIDFAYLELTPICKITDEDAIEVARIVYPGNGIFKQIEIVIDTPEGRHDDVTYVLIKKFINHPDLMEWREFALIQIDHEDGAVIRGSVNESGDFEDDFTDNYIHVTDFLRSKGYALPFHGLSVENLIEYGWVKLKQE